MDPAGSVRTHSRQSTEMMDSSEHNQFAFAVHHFKSLVINPALNIIRHTSITQRIIVLVMAAPILFLPAMFALFLIPFLLFVSIVLYILIYGAEKTERDVKECP